MNTPEFTDFMNHGIDPVGSEHTWAWTPVVKALREAEAQLATDGWTNLNDAINFVRKNYPEHFPKRYRFKRWDQLINATNLFDLGDAKLPDNHTIVFYRSHQPEAVIPSKA